MANTGGIAGFARGRASSSFHDTECGDMPLSTNIPVLLKNTENRKSSDRQYRQGLVRQSVKAYREAKVHTLSQKRRIPENKSH
jgi:hypothetical protein